MLGLGSIIGGLLGFIFGLVIFIAILGIWGGVGKIEKHTKESLRLQRFQAGLDPDTGQPRQKDQP